MDARPFEERPIPADLQMFWTKPGPGAVAAFAIVGIPDETVPVVRENPTVRETVPTVNVNFYSEPTPDGLYDYKLVLPTGPDQRDPHLGRRGEGHDHRHHVHEEDLHEEAPREVREDARSKRTFWFTEPPCPPSGQLSFEAFYGYKNEPDQLKKIAIPCPTSVSAAPDVRPAETYRRGPVGSVSASRIARQDAVSHGGTAHVRSPNSLISAGSRIRRTTVASSTTATVRPMPNWRVLATGETANARNTKAITAAAPVMIVAVFSRP